MNKYWKILDDDDSNDDFMDEIEFESDRNTPGN